MAIIVKENETATLSAKVTGHPEPIIRWFKNKDEVHNDDTFQITKQGELCTLTIKKCSLMHAADYKIEASNIGGKAASVSNIIVQKHGSINSNIPTFTKFIQNVRTKPGTTAVFTTEFSGTPLPTCSWLFNGQTITSTNDTKITTADGKSKLEIRSVSSAHVGQYSCQLTSSSGSITCSATLTLS
ncbi:unnamed protein product [Soboliphyme baturini]|uniref:Ig-like domain-containing protein n=1 Tax=Soboliphyme baturini TaxID=241478 RepID=A0A183IY35_9BILA|nr:unnamed protein product [Soboliphyme baturini]